jgi:phosphatidylinositol alpha-1,6-mannosyltransferase
MWIGVFPELSGVGGIQQVSRHTAAVLVRKARERNLDCQLLGLNDLPGPGSFHVADQEYHFRGFGRNKFNLFVCLLRLLPSLETLYFGHVNLAPLGMFLNLIHPRIQYWVVVHGVEVWEPLPLLRRFGLRRAHRVLSVSSFTAGRAVSAQKLRFDRVCVLPPALDPSFLEVRSNGGAMPITQDARMLLTVGRLISDEPGKGVDSVIRVLPDVLEAVSNIFYVVIGAGDLLPHLEDMARGSPARDQILFIGGLEPEQIKSYYARADVFVMPSRQEGFGLVFLEAMVLGKPVIAGNLGGSPEVVQDGVTGFLVDPDDLTTLTTRLIELLQDEPLRRKMGNAGRQRVEENYTFASFQDRFARVLDSAT